jgi:HipA-like protein
MNHILDVYLHDQLAGKLIQKSGQLQFQYDETYVSSKAPLPMLMFLHGSAPRD